MPPSASPRSLPQCPAPQLLGVFATGRIKSLFLTLCRVALPPSPSPAPQLLGVFATGRIEEFLPLRCLAPEEMAAARWAPAIARTLRRFHDVPLGLPAEVSGWASAATAALVANVCVCV